MNIKSKYIKEFLQRNYDIKPNSLKKISHGVINFNYLVKIAGKNYIFKIYSMRSPKEASFELDVLNYLNNKEFPSPRVVKNNQKKSYSLFKNRPSVLLNYILGKQVSEITPEILYDIGILLGRLHKILKSRKQTIKKDMQLSPEPQELKKYIKEEGKNIIKRKFPGAKKFVPFIEKEFNKIYFPDNLPIGITHQDIKSENIIMDKNNKISFIDFDNLYRGILLYDVMTTIIWTCFKKDSLQSEFVKTFMRGYESQRSLTISEKKHFHDALLFRLLREAFVWPMRSSTMLAEKNNKKFLRMYNNLTKNNNPIILWKN